MDGIEANKLDKSEASSTYAPAHVVAPPSGDATGATDLAAINAAITAANAAGGGLVVLQPGTYLIGSNLLMRSNVTLRGAGMKLTTVKLVAGGNAVITNLSWPVGNPATWAVTESNLAVEDLTVDENNLPTRYGINFKACDGVVRIQRVRAQNCTYSGIVAGQCYDVTIADCQTTATAGNGIFVYDCQRFNVYGNNILDSGDFGIEIGAGYDYGLSGGTPYGGDGAVFGNTVKSATNFGIGLRGYLDGSANPNNHYVLNTVVTGNTVRDCGNNISYYELTDNIIIVGNNTSMSGSQTFESARLHVDLGGTDFTSGAVGAIADITGLTVTTPNNRPKCRADIKLRLRANSSLAGTDVIYVDISPAPADGQASAFAVEVGVAGADDAFVVLNDVILAANTAYTIKAQFYQSAAGTFTVQGSAGNTELIAFLTPLT